MKSNVNYFFKKITYSIFLAFCCYAQIHAQQNQVVAEPAIPIYIVCPYHEDSLKAALGNSGSVNNAAMAYIDKKYDSLDAKFDLLQGLSTVSFVGLLILFSLLTALSILILISTKQTRESLTIIKDIVQQVNSNFNQINLPNKSTTEENNISELGLNQNQKTINKSMQHKRSRR